MNGEATVTIRDIIMPATLALLPAKMDTPQARALLLAIGLQESRFVYRKQVDGPARGYWQFERAGGVRGVLSHDATRPHILAVLEALNYHEVAQGGEELAALACHASIADNDFLACAFARLLLWTSPAPLPKRDDTHGGWLYYLHCWRPGKPHPGTWDDIYRRAWDLIADEIPAAHG